MAIDLFKETKLSKNPKICPQCLSEIYTGDYVKEIAGEEYHSECALEFVHELREHQAQ